MAFYNRVWAKDDPFWAQNQPGNLWNCKCDWEETDDPCTSDNPQTPIRHNGLEGNPAQTGQIFTDNAAYVKGAGNNPSVEEFVRTILRWHNDYRECKKNDDYTLVEYDYNGGGMLAVHKGHQMHNQENSERYFEELTSMDLELACGRQLM